jgi:hypothetical protein
MRFSVMAKPLDQSIAAARSHRGRVTPVMLAARWPMFPELDRARRDPRRLRASRPARQLLAAIEPLLADLRPIPDTPYSFYRMFARSGDRARFEACFFQRRRNLAAAALGQFLRPRPETLAAVHDYLWAICEESTWILPAHERGGIDLFACETALWLTETLALLEGQIAPEVATRVRAEVERQVVGPFMAFVAGAPAERVPDGRENLADLVAGRQPHSFGWINGHNNWNGVCSGAMGAVMLWLEPDPRRLARGLNALLGSLERFLDTAFCADGASDEGVSYWQYGLVNFAAFAELLRGRTRGRVDLLAHPRMKPIARFPLAVCLSPGRFYNPADCPPALELAPGLAARLAARTGVRDLPGLAAGRLNLSHSLSTTLRSLLWWDGRSRRAPSVRDSLLSAAGVFRLRSGGLVLAGKAGHNFESHNHNDVGSFVLHCGGEDLLCDPGAPPYTREFFGPRRYELFLQAQSRGHSVPVVDGRQQSFGRAFCGRIERFDPGATRKSVEMEIAGAYPVKRLRSLRRKLELLPGGRFVLEDRFAFPRRPLPVEEAFVTWLPVTVRGSTAIVSRAGHSLKLRISKPRGARFRLEQIKLQTHGREPLVLRRIGVKLPRDMAGTFVLEGAVRRRSGHFRPLQKGAGS